MKKYPGYSDFRTVDAEQISSYPDYEILDSFDISRATTVSCFVPVVRDSWVEDRTKQEAVVEKHQMFLIGLPEESVITRLNRELKASVEVNAMTCNESKAKDSEISKLQKEISDLTTSNAQTSIANADLKTQAETYKTKAQKMEADLASLRKAIGEIEFNKIVGGPVGKV